MSMLIRAEDEPPVAPFELRADTEHGFRGQIRTGRVGTVGVTEVSCTTVQSRRTPKLVRHSDLELFKIDVQVRGHTVFAQDEREAALRPGDFTLMDLSHPSHVGIRGDGHEVLAVQFPHAALPLRHDELARLTAVPISGQSGLGAPISTLARHLGRHLAGYGGTDGAGSPRR